ncbi:IclR family transcriptional regulator [Enemella evansiae]|uniref:IclR family transcriptional regulator n=1 Tax=Enemella evansiae TaxID=2016499 RepID=UPI000B97C88A|nr:IclR family transcriptional regulator [Enemella evansiae]OYO11266.1 IclR family transcriptional regulator [Enemella evansiae]
MAGNAREPARTVTNKVVAVLTAFGRTDGPLSLAEVRRATGLPAATALRLLRELTAGGLLVREDSGSYRASTLLWEIGSRTARRGDIRDAALPYLEDLFIATGQNVQLAVLSGTHALVVEKIHGRDSVTMASLVASRLALHATGVGKVLLAYAGPELFERLVAEGLERFTPNTIVDPGRLARALERAREAGVVYQLEERELGLISVAAPVWGPNQRVVAALSVSTRASSTVLRRLTPAVVTAARGVSRALAGPAAAARRGR